MSDELKQLTQVFINTFPEKAQALESAWAQWLAHPNNSNAENLHKQLHELSGSTGLYGFLDIHEACQDSLKLLSNNPLALKKTGIQPLLSLLDKHSQA
ncbi:MAG: Hpt domain-containing protein [bacterium]